MKKKFIVKKSNDFTNIIKNSHFFKCKGFIIYIKHNNIDHYRFGISVTNKIGNAVVRNKIKRQIRMIINDNKKYYQNNLDYIIIVKNGFLDYSFQEIKESFEKVIKEINR